MQSLRIGDLGIVAAGAEIFVKTGLEVKQRSPFEKTIFNAYTNGCLSYIPLPEDYPRGGYEVFEAYLGYGLPAPVDPQSAELVVQNALELLQQVS
jgi:neutral ceramidase